VGSEDPNIIGDAGPTDVAPGHDPDLPPLAEPLPPEEETPAERLLPSDEDSDLELPVQILEPSGASDPPADGDPAEGIEVEVVEVIEVVVIPVEEDNRG
jgi:hypothetical protein